MHTSIIHTDTNHTKGDHLLKNNHMLERIPSKVKFVKNNGHVRTHTINSHTQVVKITSESKFLKLIESRSQIVHE